ncbi:MAG: hypothetical protein GEV07_22215 [Streptosporangiales bacterium]|nr:hypothetical protein [Streptosporangiales bacterium]
MGFTVLVVVLAVAVAGVADFFIEKSLAQHGLAQGLSAAEVTKKRRNTRLGIVALTLPVVIAAVVVTVLG